MVCNGEPTREWLGREETASPTAHSESMSSSAVIDAHEARDVVTSDAPNAFVQTWLDNKEGDDKVIMKTTGVLADDNHRL